MIHITKGADQNIIFTGLELATLSNPKYLFIFTSANEKIVKFVGTNISTDNRFQEVVVAKAKFNRSEPGTWRYKIREQASATNVDEALSGGIVEEGFMYLHEACVETPVEYAGNCNEFKSYNCEQ